MKPRRLVPEEWEVLGHSMIIDDLPTFDIIVAVSYFENEFIPKGSQLSPSQEQLRSEIIASCFLFFMEHPEAWL